MEYKWKMEWKMKWNRIEQNGTERNGMELCISLAGKNSGPFTLGNALHHY